jgi:hypothetical protein
VPLHGVPEAFLPSEDFLEFSATYTAPQNKCNGFSIVPRILDRSRIPNQIIFLALMVGQRLPPEREYSSLVN